LLFVGFFREQDVVVVDLGGNASCTVRAVAKACRFPLAQRTGDLCQSGREDLRFSMSSMMASTALAMPATRFRRIRTGSR
jgi:hypothetical protein